MIQDKEPFKLNPLFLMQYAPLDPDWSTLGYVVYKRTYAREIGDRTEEWVETLERVVNGVYRTQQEHCLKLNLPWSNQKAQKSAKEMFSRMWDFKFLPPGRGLKMMGTDYVAQRGGACLNNCAFVSTENIDQDFTEPFCFLMDMSMLGVGVGFDTDGAGKVQIIKPTIDPNQTYIIEDTREGWVDALRVVLNAYVDKGSKIPRQFDFNKIRPKGSPIKGLGGVSSGAQPLFDLLQKIINLLNGRISQNIRSTDILDIMNLIGVCVISGNVRRSAELALGDWKDYEFTAAKDPTLYGQQVNDYRWASNNTVKVFEDDAINYRALVEETLAKNVDLGYLWLDNARNYGRMIDQPNFKDSRAKGTNPCGEQTLESHELCNLVETFPARHDDFSDYQRTLKFAYLYAKTVSLIPTHNAKTNAIMLRNRRIGTSMSGIHQAVQKIGFSTFIDWCGAGYSYINKLDQIYSDWLCVPTSIKKTSVKPSGSVSLLAGATPGIHAPESQYYNRLVRFDTTSPLLTTLYKANYRCEIIENEPNTTAVFFPTEEKYFERAKKDISMWEQFELAAQLQAIWADNQVSITITFQPHEVKDIPRALEFYSSKLKAVSLLPLSTHGHKYAPLQAITKDEYEAAIANLKPVVFSGNTNEVAEKFCDNDGCVYEPSK